MLDADIASDVSVFRPATRRPMPVIHIDRFQPKHFRVGVISLCTAASDNEIAYRMVSKTVHPTLRPSRLSVCLSNPYTDCDGSKSGPHHPERRSSGPNGASRGQNRSGLVQRLSSICQSCRKGSLSNTVCSLLISQPRLREPTLPETRRRPSAATPHMCPPSTRHRRVTLRVTSR